MSVTASSSGLKYKLIFGFILSFALIGFAAIYAYQNFNKLLGSVETLSTPEHSVDALQKVINMMYEADGNMRNYIMTTDRASLDAYMDEMGKLSLELEEMKQDEAFSNSETTIDSLNEYFKDKVDLMYSLVIFRQSSEYARLNSKAMSKISSKAETETSAEPISPDLTSQEPDIKQPSISQKNQTSSTTDSRNSKNNKAGKKDEGFLKNLFSKKDKSTPNIVTDVPIVVLNDTSSNPVSPSSLQYTIAANPSLNVEDVRRILREIDAEQKKYNKQLDVKELEILASDKVILTKINEVIDRIKAKELNDLQSQLDMASTNAKASSQTMLYIATTALLTGLVFLGIILIDINRSNRVKKQLIEARQRAEYLAKAKEDFLANMSHEIRTPLNAIIGFSEQLESTPLQNTQRKFVRAVSNAGAHLLSTVNDILDISKIEAGKLAIDIQPMYMNDVIEEVSSILEIKAQEKGLQLIINPDETGEIPVMGDAFRIKQILYNITGNAIKFTDSGFVQIKCEHAMSKNIAHYRITVEDTGIGIAPEKVTNIFESFEQGESSITRKFGGTGLGLSISKKLIELLGGKIDVKSELGKGSSFIVTLSLPEAPAGEAEAMATMSNETSDLLGMEVLLVDDEPFNLMLAEIILKKYGAVISTASNGAEALTLIDVRSFDIVLADLHMPEVDGYMLANKIRERYLQVPLIALTANVMQNDIQKIHASGFNDILLKPYKEKDLLQMIAKYAPVVFGKDMINKPEDQTVQNELFDLQEIKKFADNDNIILISIIESFIHNNSLNLYTLKDAVAKNDLHVIRNTSHKMLPSYNHFQVHDLIFELKQMEVVQSVEEIDIAGIYEKVERVSKLVFTALESAARKLKESIPV